MRLGGCFGVRYSGWTVSHFPIDTKLSGEPILAHPHGLSPGITTSHTGRRHRTGLELDLFMGIGSEFVLRPVWLVMTIMRIPWVMA